MRRSGACLLRRSEISKTLFSLQSQNFQYSTLINYISPISSFQTHSSTNLISNKLLLCSLISSREYAGRGGGGRGGREQRTRPEKQKNKKNKKESDNDDEDEDSELNITELTQKFRSEFDTKSKATLDHVTTNLATLRVGRANPEILYKVKLSDGSLLKNHSSIFVKDAKTLGISPADPGKLLDMEKAIIEADLGAVPRKEGDMLVLPLPKATKELKAVMMKQVVKVVDQSKVTVRSVRQTVMGAVKEYKAKLGKDDYIKLEKEIQELHDKTIKKLEEVQKAKENSLEQS